ncbi:MAG: deoxyhypusine synthase family protein [Acidobacteriota bacterium]|nr:deoxyhypusine synthase family protein [Blastocatellia bacterium]MDQ3219440.1 deoxyhypusine synthase family protein [Acidobacteriota bacterium]MDQ3490497.1 deoxyhypusine synthase family protein [Acidobacteriota bacterium]
MMVAQKKTKSSKFLTVPTRPVPIDRDRSVAGLLEKMEGAGFGAKQLAEAHRIWLDMLDDNSTIYLCGSGNLISSGMRRLLAYVIKNRFVDVIVMSGSVLFQDIHETLGRNHYQAHPSMSDEELEASDVMRMGDTLANSDEYHEADEWVGSVINQLDLTRSYSMREFLHLMGRELAEIAHEDGIMTASFKSRIPIFCPDLISTELSVGIARARFEKKSHLTFDTTQDTMDMMQIAQKTRNSGIITLGSTCSQSMVNMAEISSYITRTTPRGHKYAISITTDSVPLDIRTPSFAGNHTDLFGKLLRGATTAYVPSDPSIALPMIITALSQTAAKFMKGRKRPTFSFAGKEMTIEVP